MNPEKGTTAKGFASGGTMIRMLGVQQTNEVKATQNLAIIVLFFMICWIPLYTINCILAFRPDFYVNETFMLCCIILSHLNSAGNPILYAYHLKDFRAALKHFFCSIFDGKRPYCDSFKQNHMSSYKFQMRKRSSCNSAMNLTSRMAKVKLMVPDKISTIVKSSTAVAAATTGDISRTIWKISENSASSSSDSVKSAGSGNHDKALMIRPATPYRPRIVGENYAYSPTDYPDDESDDGFNEDETLPNPDYGFGQCIDRIVYSKSCDKTLSTSSPQLSRGFFCVEDEIKKGNYQPAGHGSDSLGLSPFKARKQLNRSLSDTGNFCVKTTSMNGVVHSCAS